jgi:acetyl-CoA acetyltransferase
MGFQFCANDKTIIPRLLVKSGNLKMSGIEQNVCKRSFAFFDITLQLNIMKKAYVIDSVRTPIGKYGGVLSTIRPDDLLAHVIKALLQRSPTIDVNAIEDVIAGDANQAGEDNRNVARMAALLAGLPVSVAGNTVNRLCASGLQAIMDAARSIMCNEGELYIAAGVESMTRAPLVMAKAPGAWNRSTEILTAPLVGVSPIRRWSICITHSQWVKRRRM